MGYVVIEIFKSGFGRPSLVANGEYDTLEDASTAAEYLFSEPQVSIGKSVDDFQIEHVVAVEFVATGFEQE